MVVIGSQAILASFPDAPDELLVSMEADLYPRDEPEKADLIDGSIGEMSPFHGAFGYYAHGVGPDTAMLPGKWRDRLVRLENADTGGCVGWCLSPSDLAVSKLLAGREKDFLFVTTMIHHQMVRKPELEALALELSSPNAEILRGRLSCCR